MKFRPFREGNNKELNHKKIATEPRVSRYKLYAECYGLKIRNSIIIPNYNKNARDGHWYMATQPLCS